jgi:hypothetical protein
VVEEEAADDYNFLSLSLFAYEEIDATCKGNYVP